MTKIVKELMKKYNRRTVNVLGTEYLIQFKNEEEDPELKNLSGYCANNTKEIVVHNSINYFEDKSDEWVVNDIKSTIRHELIHAFFNESGLILSAVFNSHWSKNEEMVDWLAVQSPKIFKVFQELDLLECETGWNKVIKPESKKRGRKPRNDEFVKKNNEKEYYKEYFQKNKERLKEYRKKYYQKNKEKLKEYNNKYRQKRREEAKKEK